jgi:hypothetical protein
MGNSSGVFKNLSNAECISKYSGNFVTDVGELLAVTHEDFRMGDKIGTVGVISTAAGAGGNSIYFTGYAPAAHTTEQPRVMGSLGYLFVCADQVTRDATSFGALYSDRQCNVDALFARPESWTIGEASIAYCLSEVRQERCKLQFSVAIFWLVAASNLVKVACMLWILLRIKDKNTLVTLGDAINSFLQCSDPATENQCLLSKEDIKKSKWTPGLSMSKTFTGPNKVLWLRAASRWQWAACIVLYADLRICIQI